MKKFLRGLGIFIALVGVGVASAFAVVALLLRQEEVRVPDLAGQDIVSVLEIVTQQGLQLKVDRREPSPSILRDTVIAQTPAAASAIKKGRLVHVVVSQGPSELLAPALVGENFRKADLMIRQGGFVPGEIARVSSGGVERDLVIAQQPQAGSPLEKGGAVNLLVSSGKKTTLVVMPRLTGVSATEALRTVERMGMQHRVVTRTATDGNLTAERTVINQKPAAGYPVAPDTTVDIVVAK